MKETAEFTQAGIRDMLARWMGSNRVPARVNIITDTSDFLRVDYDDVVIVGDEPYLLRNYEREKRLGVDDEPKFWVRRAISLKDGTQSPQNGLSRKIRGQDWRHNIRLRPKPPKRSQNSRFGFRYLSFDIQDLA